MKRLLVGTLLLCSLVSASAFATTIIGFAPDDGSGDNFGFTVYGNGMYVTGGGGTPFEFFNAIVGYPPGFLVGGITDIFFDGGFARIGPISANVFFDFGILFMSTITLPTNGLTVTKTLRRCPRRAPAALRATLRAPGSLT